LEITILWVPSGDSVLATGEDISTSFSAIVVSNMGLAIHIKGLKGKLKANLWG